MKSKHAKVWLFYGVLLTLFAVLTYFLVINGESLEKQVQAGSGVATTGVSGHASLNAFFGSVWINICQPAAMLLLQMIAILFFARFLGYLFGKIGQPAVIGEILAGIVLGPSIFGKLFPVSFNFLFAQDSLNNIYYLSQVGLILFMFVIGMELNLATLKDKIRETLVISHAGILFPFFLGMVLAYYLYKDFAIANTGYLSFALFIGISLSITAFPVLARIIQEKDLTRTHLGTMSLGSAAIGDVTAWCLLACVIAISKTGSMLSSLFTILMTILYIAVMLLVVRPFLKKLGDVYRTSELVNKSMVAFIFLLLLISSYLTQVIGIHALFGAFLAGVVMPPLTNFRKIIIDKIEDVSVTFLLPLFFVFTGLRTEIGLVNTPQLWGLCGIIILVAILGKFGGTALAARFMGENWRDSLSMGILMNTRGLMELIVLNIGYEMGILPPTLFVMLVIMALLTTFMTTPMLSLITHVFPPKNKQQERIYRQTLGIFKALVAVGNPDNGRPLLNVAKTVLDGYKNSLFVNVLHITVGTDTNLFMGEQYLEEGFKLVRTEAESLGIPIETEYKVTDNIGHEIVHTVNDDDYDFLLVGSGSSMVVMPGKKRIPLLARIPFLRILYRNINEKQVFYPGSLIKDKSRYFIENCHCSVGVFVNRNFVQIRKTIVVLNREDDVFLLRYARRLLRNDKAVTIRIMDLKGLYTTSDIVAQGILSLLNEFPDSVKMCKGTMDDGSYMVNNFTFMLISYQTWNQLVATEKEKLAFVPSTLIINKKRSRFHKINSVVDHQKNKED